MDALKAATSVNARAFHLEESLGNLKPGFIADVIVVDGDPSKNISDVKKVKFVMKEGVVYLSLTN
jgi:imidazolonepropionase-like amidohydrolase